MTRDELDALYHAATGNGPSRERPITWGAEALEVDRRTVSRWLAGETRPTPRQVAQLRVAARAAGIRRGRASESSRLARLRGWFNARAAERAIVAAATETLITRLIANRELDRDPSERDALPGGRLARHPHLFRDRRGSDFLQPGGATRYLRGGPR